MIRDGLTLKKKVVLSHWENITKFEYKENFLISIIHAEKMYRNTKVARSFAYINDPYGIMLLLNPIGVNIEDFDLENGAEYPTLSCREYYEAIVEDRVEDIVDRMTAEEKFYCILWSKRKIPITSPEGILRAISFDIGLKWEYVRSVWTLQPSPAAVAFALASHRVKTELFTPAIGIPYVMIEPSNLVEKIRYPCMVTELYDGDDYLHIQIHKDGDVFEAWTIEESVKDEPMGLWLPPDLYSFMRDIGISYVVEAYLGPDDELWVTDVLCWNDIWMHDRPLAERVKFSWHFEPYTPLSYVCKRREDLDVALDDLGCVCVRNFNSVYDPSVRDSHIAIQPDSQTVFLEVGGMKGGFKNSFLKTSDNKAVFKLNCELTPDEKEKEYGGVVEVFRDGTIKRVDTKMRPSDWATVATAFKFDLDYDVWRDGRMFPECIWVNR